MRRSLWGWFVAKGVAMSSIQVKLQDGATKNQTHLSRHLLAISCVVSAGASRFFSFTQGSGFAFARLTLG